MSTPQANPLGAESASLTAAAEKIGKLGLANPEPKGQPEAKPETARANQEPERQRDERGKFVRQAEPERAETAEVEEVKETTETKATAETTDDSEELPEALEDLAAAIGVDWEKFSDHVKAKVKVGGEERTVNLKELAAGYQMQSDYQRKTAEIAEQRKAAEAERSAYQQQRERFASELQPLLQQLSTQVVNDTAEIERLYAQGDFQEAARLQFVANQRKDALAKAQAEDARISGEKQREEYQARVDYVAKQEALLLERKPAWKDVEKGKRELTAIREYLKSEGVPAQQADGLYEAIPLLMAEKAMLWDKHVKSKPDKLQELKALPKFQKPGAAKPAEDPQKQKVHASLNRLRKTGKVEDAAKAFKAMGIT